MLDVNAIHGNTAGEINAIAEKAVPVNADLVIIEDSAAGNVKKRVQVGNLPAGGGGDADAIHDNISGEINAITEKVTPVAADLLIIEDSAAGNVKKKLQIGNLPGGGGTDPDAIHDNVASEIHVVTNKATPVAADEVLIEDSADSWNKKRVALTNLLATTDDTAIHDNVAGEIHAITNKATPVSADELVIEDSADSWNKKRVALTNLLATTDDVAIHDNVAGEIHAITNKATPVSADELVIEDSADSWNKKRVAISALPTGGGGLGYTLSVLAYNWNPVDSETTYFGSLPRAPGTTEGKAKIYIPKAGTLKVAEIWTYAAGTVGSNEDWSLYVRLNGAGDTLVATVAAATGTRQFSNTGLSVAVAVGDYVEIKSVQPAWATNPAGVYISGCLYIE